MHSFRDETKTNSTTLSKFIWTNKLNQDEHGNIVEPKIKWSIMKHCSTYQPGNRTCDLCISEKVLIIKNINKPSNINKRTDCAQTCYHKRHYLSSVTWNNTRELSDISRSLTPVASKDPRLSKPEEENTTHPPSFPDETLNLQGGNLSRKQGNFYMRLSACHLEFFSWNISNSIYLFTSSYPFNPERKHFQKWCFSAHFQFFCSHRK